MTEKKNTVETKPRKKIKATTGAWWKSTVVEVEHEEVVDHSTEPQTKTGNAQEEKQEEQSAPQPSAGSKPRPRRTNSTPKEPSTADATLADTATEQDLPTSRQTASAGGRRETTETEPVQTLESEPSAAAQVPPQEGERATKPRRPRRKRSTKPKKPAAENLTEGDTEAGSSEEGAKQEGASVELVASTGEEPAKPSRTPRKRAPRKKKPATEKQAATGKKPQAQEKGQDASDADATMMAETVSEQESATATQAESAGDAQTAAAETDPAVAEDAVEKKKKPAQRKPRGRKKSGAKPSARGSAASREGDLGGVALEDLEPGEETDQLLDEEEFEEEDVQVSDQLPEEEPAEKEGVVLKLLINAEEPEECRLALLENGRLESIHVSTITRAQTKNNIYKGRIVAIEPNLQAAFVDYGTEKNGFLPFSEIHPEYYKQDLSPEINKLVEAHFWKKLSIIDVVEKGQDVLVQVVKEEVGKKGANMTTYLSLPGRSVVLMPGSDSSGISRKIVGEERRAQLRNAMNALEIPEGIGWIVRTASADITKTALTRDVDYLLRLWEEIKKKAQELDGVGQVYEDHQSVLRFLREHFDPAIDEILVDDSDALKQVKDFIALLPTKQQNVKVRMHRGSRPIFNQFSIEDQIESIYQPRVNLPSGGSIVIEPTEALVSIDVNSGSTSKGKNFDQSIYQANMEAAAELARQLRLRDLGGLIVVDFIDMRNKKHVRDVERQLKQAMKRDKAKVDFTRISKFGLMQISRQKLGAPIEAGNYRVCEHCKGRGTVRSVETLALFYLRRIQTGASRKHVSWVECRFPLDVAQYLLNNKRQEVMDLEARHNTEITIVPEPGMNPADHDIILHKAEKEANGKKQA